MNQRPSHRRVLRYYIEHRNPGAVKRCADWLHAHPLTTLVLVLAGIFLFAFALVRWLPCFDGGESIPVGLLGGAGLMRRCA